MQSLHPAPLGLSTSQAAEALGVSLGTIRRWSDMGYLQSYRTPGGQRRFSRDQIEQFLVSLQPERAEPHDEPAEVAGRARRRLIQPQAPVPAAASPIRRSIPSSTSKSAPSAWRYCTPSPPSTSASTST